MATPELALVMEKRDAGAGFEDMLRAHERLILRLCYRLLGNLEDAQDTAQDVFLRAYSRFAKLDGDPLPWLRTVAVNACRDRLRRRRPAAPLEELRSSALSPEAAAGDEQRRRLLMEALQTLGERERTALVLRDLEGIDTREVAALLEVTEETVRSQCSTARTKLKEYVERRTRR